MLASITFVHALVSLSAARITVMLLVQYRHFVPLQSESWRTLQLEAASHSLCASSKVLVVGSQCSFQALLPTLGPSMYVLEDVLEAASVVVIIAEVVVAVAVVVKVAVAVIGSLQQSRFMPSSVGQQLPGKFNTLHAGTSAHATLCVILGRVASAVRMKH